MYKYSYRPYTSGDENSINDLYAKITGRIRSKAAYFWQWQNAPGGKGEVWVIEAELPNGQKMLIGHHGIMPVRFSYGQDDLLFGKTENTFVHPDFRSKILYPRFERRFAYHYENRFHALFSTLGPRAAIRQRQAQGYVSEHLWKTYIWGLRPLSDIYYLISYYSKRYNKSAEMFIPVVKNESDSYTRLPGINIRCYNDHDALFIDFFRTFWSSVKRSYPVTPSRYHEDLKWRFWDNPYISYQSLILDSELYGSAMAVISNTVPGTIRVDDFIVEHPKSKSFRLLFEALITWARMHGAYRVIFTTTSDSVDWVGHESLQLQPNFSFARRIYDIFAKSDVRMPRKICTNGQVFGITCSNWFVTSMIFEGIS